MTQRDIHKLFFGDGQFMDITSPEFVDKLSKTSEREFVAIIGLLLEMWGNIAAQESYEQLKAETGNLSRATAMILLMHRCLTLNMVLSTMAKNNAIDPSPGALQRAMRIAMRVFTDKEE